MRLLTAPDIGFFFDRVRSVRSSVLFLDYDGTLAPLRADPRESLPDPEIHHLVNSILESRRTRVVVVSGRRASELASLLGPFRRPEIWGSHGLERLGPDGAYEAAPISAEVRRLLLEEEDWWARRGWRLRLDAKPFGIVLNGRGLPADTVRTMRSDARDRWSSLLGSGLVVQESEHGIELRLGGRDKGTAVRTVLAESGDHAIGAYLGDDCTDEEAFRAIRGHGLGALVRPAPRATAAGLWLRPPGEVLEFLTWWRVSVGAARGRA